MKKTSSRARVAPMLQWLPEAAAGYMRIAVTQRPGRPSAMVENLTGIANFTPECVQLRTPSGELTITGDDLSLTEVRRGALIVTGHIKALHLPDGEAGDNS